MRLLFTALACLISVSLFAQEETILLDYDFNGWMPTDLEISCDVTNNDNSNACNNNGLAQYDTLNFVWRSVSTLDYTIFTTKSCSFNGTNFLTAGNYEYGTCWDEDGVVYETDILFPLINTVGFDSLFLSFDVLAYGYTGQYSHAYLELGFEVSNDNGLTWYTVWEPDDTSIGGVNACSFQNVVTNISDYEAENLKVKLYHRGWKFSLIDNIKIVGFGETNQNIGCTYPNACNYNPTAELEDQSCYFIGDSCDDNNANTFNDIYSDSCDCTGETFVFGCTDEEACNYDEAANNDNGSCWYANLGYNCDGECLSDLDEDGICDEDEISGCTYSSACNFLTEAEFEDYTCIFVGDLCDDGDPNTLDDEIQEDCECTGTPHTIVEELMALSVLIYPNPASSNLTIDLGDLTGVNTSIKLYDSSSKLVFEKQSSSTLLIDVSVFAQGLYTLELSTSDKVLRSKVVLE